MFSFICFLNKRVNNREAGDLRRQRVHYDVIVMRMNPLSDIIPCRGDTTTRRPSYTPLASQVKKELINLKHKIMFKFRSLHDTWVSRELKIFPHQWQAYVYPISPSSWLRMTWRCKEPGHAQQAYEWYIFSWIFGIRFITSSTTYTHILCYSEDLPRHYVALKMYAFIISNTH